MDKVVLTTKEFEAVAMILEFYADSDNYIFTDDGKGIVLPEVVPRIQSDMGHEACKALEILQKYVTDRSL